MWISIIKTTLFPCRPLTERRLIACFALPVGRSQCSNDSCSPHRRVVDYGLSLCPTAIMNSSRRDLQALGALEKTSGDAALLSIPPAEMTDEQLDAAIVLIKRQRPSWRDDIERVEFDAPPSS